MISKVERFQHMNYIVSAVNVFFPQLIQQPHLDKGLMMESLFVPDYFDGHMLIGFVVQRSYHLSEAALSNDLKYFVSVRYVIVHNLSEKIMK